MTYNMIIIIVIIIIIIIGLHHIHSINTGFNPLSHILAHPSREMYQLTVFKLLF